MGGEGESDGKRVPGRPLIERQGGPSRQPSCVSEACMHVHEHVHATAEAVGHRQTQAELTESQLLETTHTLG